LNINDLKQPSALAMRLGVKALAYGPPGGGKTPISGTAPNPVMCITEPGMLSMRNSPLGKCAWPAFDSKSIDEFFAWFFGSKESKNFDSLVLDSASQMAEIYIKDAEKNNKHGLKAYGEANEKVLDILNKLYFMPEKHIYVICKQEIYNDSGIMQKRPFFPGKEVPIKAPHLFDAILHVAKVVIPGYGEQTAIRCKPTFDIMARDRSGNLNDLEPPNLTELFKKAFT